MEGRNEEQQEGDMNNMTEEQLISAKRRLQQEMGYSDGEASMIIMWRALAPLVKIAFDKIELRRKVAAYEKSETEKLQNQNR